MAIDVRLSELLEELHDSGRTPEEVCADFPDLLPELRERWRQIRRLEAQLDLVFPPDRPGSAGGEHDRGDEGEPAAERWPRVAGYEVEGVLGRGGMGVVLRARHLRLNRVVALKLALAGAYATPHERERFQREAEAVASLRHPHVVRIYDVGDSEGRPYFTMELVEGGSLAERATPLAPREAASLVLALAGAVEAAHLGGIVHRDLKPANVLMERDGTPKVGDFGLSRRLDDASLSLPGSVVGTPRYMAPEQASGEQGRVGKAVDIHALGVILYELLAGRPPFLGATPSETIRQVVHADPARPSTHNAKIPRDLETICLKCLSKDPDGRYTSAGALGDDLRRFLDGEAIAARPEGRAARLRRRIGRNPAAAAGLTGGALGTAALLGSSLWLAADRVETARRAAADRSATERAAAADLREMARLMGDRAWSAASAARGRAEGRLEGRGSAPLRSALERGRRDLELVARLEGIRLGRARTVGGAFDSAGSENAYRDAFSAAGLGNPGDDPEAVAARVRASDVRPALVDALDDWSSHARDASRKDWILRTAASAAMAERSSWAEAARDPESRRSRAALERLADQAPADDGPLTLLLAVAEDLSNAGADPLPLLERVQRGRPGDFWANLSLGSILAEAGQFAEATRFLQAAVAIRPSVAIAHNNLGRSLTDLGRLESALDHFRAAVRLDPTARHFRYNLAYALRQSGQADAAIGELRAGLQRDPGAAILHAGLGDALAAKSRDDEALAAYSAALAIDPQQRMAQTGRRAILLRLGRSDQAQAAWHSAIEAAPGDLDVADGYAEFCLFLDRRADYEAARRDLLGHAIDLHDPRAAERVGRACLLAPAPPPLVEQAAALIDRALVGPVPPDLAWTRPYFLLAHGLALHREGRSEEALAIVQGEAAGTMGPCPLLIAALTQQQLGRTDEARRSLDRALAAFDWDHTEPTTRELWIYHILRREAERLIAR